MDLLSVLENVWLLLWSFAKFLVFSFKSLFNLVFKTFSYVFSPDLFDSIGDTFQNLSLFIWTPWALVLVSLFFISFLLIFLGFIFRVIKWQVHYKSTIKKFWK